MRPQHLPGGIFLLAAGLALAVLPAIAETPAGPKKGARKYDLAAEITVTGMVLDVKTVMTPSGQEVGRVVLGTDGGEAEVELGPSSFLTEKGLDPAKGDRAVVVGSMARIDGSEVLLAREIRLGSKAFRLRDEKGVPVWPRGSHP